MTLRVTVEWLDKPTNSEQQARRHPTVLSKGQVVVLAMVELLVRLEK